MGGRGGRIHHGHSLSGGRRVGEQMPKRAAESVEEADLRSADMGTGARACRSGHA